MLAEVMRAVSASEAEMVQYAEPQFSLAEVDEAGDYLIGFTGYDQPVDDESWYYLDRAYAIINNWRASHSFPLNTFQVGLRGRALSIDNSSVSAQRIKRLSSIELKLKRFSWLKLSAMQDIGGCRAVMSSVKDVRKLVNSYKESRIKHKLDDSDDYIEKPKKSGYRGIHLIYCYHSDRKETYNDRKIEMQLRSALQHAWATAVETVGTFIQQALKSSTGEKDWLRFFALMGTALALREGTPPVPGTPATKADLRKELREYVKRLDVEARLEAYGHALDVASTDIGKNAHYFLVRLDPVGKKTSVTGFTVGQVEQAAKEYLKVEREIAKQQGDAVLVSVDSIAALRRAYPNYFLDTRVFLDAVKQAIK